MWIAPTTWLIVPCYNEAGRLDARAFVAFLQSCSGVRLCFVDDGSSDDTPALLDSLVRAAPERIAALRLERNSGKAEAVRRGVLHALCLAPAEYVGYWDADLATPLTELPRMFAAAAEAPQADVLMGCRLKRLGAAIARYWYRHLLGRVFATLVAWILRLPVYDTQCGAKVFRSGLAAAIFAAPFRSRWCFDVELLARIANRFGRQSVAHRVLEVPLRRWQDVGGSKIRPSTLLTVALDLWNLFRLYRLTKGPKVAAADLSPAPHFALSTDDAREAVREVAADRPSATRRKQAATPALLPGVQRAEGRRDRLEL